MDGLLPLSWPALAFVLGALVGSFLNVVIARLPEGESIVLPGSRCPHCRTPIPPYLNVPILSWIVLRGRCRSCRVPISPRYPLVELLTALLFTACAVRFGPTPAGGLAMAFAAAMVAVTFVDIDIWEIPDEISLPGAIIGAAASPWAFGTPWWSGAMGAALGGLSLLLVRWAYQWIRGEEGMGLGDVKLIAMIGAFVGPGGLLPTIMVASLSGTVVGSVVLWAGRESDAAAEPSKQSEIPEPSDGDAPGGVPRPVAPAAEGRSSPEDPSGQPEDLSGPGLEDGEDWEPPPNAVPFGPFLALGGLTQLLMGPALQGIFPFA